MRGDLVAARRRQLAHREHHRLLVAESRSASRIASLAVAEPPGELMRTTTPLTWSLSASSSIVSTDGPDTMLPRLRLGAVDDAARQVQHDELLVLDLLLLASGCNMLRQISS